MYPSSLSQRSEVSNLAPRGQASTRITDSPHNPSARHGPPPRAAEHIDNWPSRPVESMTETISHLHPTWASSEDINRHTTQTVGVPPDRNLGEPAGVSPRTTRPARWRQPPDPIRSPGDRRDRTTGRGLVGNSSSERELGLESSGRIHCSITTGRVPASSGHDGRGMVRPAPGDSFGAGPAAARVSTSVRHVD